jgi:photosystem II stability/assembly factor-like uncharacterized protein
MVNIINSFFQKHVGFPQKVLFRFLAIVIFLISSTSHSYAQLRQIHIETVGNDISKTSFYSISEGYVGFHNFVGYTTDSGRTFIQKKITISNVNFNNYAVNLTFGFDILGVKAFNKNNIIVYGDYGAEPSILYSSDQGNTFKLIFHAPLVPGNLESDVTDMVFPSNGSIGYAANGDRVLKTTDGGLTWAIGPTLSSPIKNLQSLSDNQVYAYGNNGLYSTIDGGINWKQIQTPSGNLQAVYFLTGAKAYLNLYDGSVYNTTNSGVSWVKQNNIQIAPFVSSQMVFTNDSTGYALSGNFEVYKTSNSGKIWEPLHRDNHFLYLNYSFNYLQLSGTSMWAGGANGFLELSTNSGGTPIPAAIFAIDTTSVSVNGLVNLVNYSKSGYKYTWLRNGKAISNTYNTTYNADLYGPNDTVKLVVSNNLYADTVAQYTSFSRQAVVSNFAPKTGPIGTTINITGVNFYNVTGVSIGGVAAASFKVTSSGTITAVVGKGASGDVAITTTKSHGSFAGFVFISPPKISSVTPLSAVAGSTITINGANFNGITAITFGTRQATSFNVISSNQIQAVLGSGSTGDLIVYSFNGNDTAHNFKVLPLLSSVSPASGGYGALIDFTGNTLSDVTSVTVDGFPVKSFTAISSTELVIVLGDGITGNNITVTNAGGSSTFTAFTYYRPPTITSFTPASGPAGSSITINGTNFSSVASENIVYFGPVRAVVSAATTTSLTVIVPAGATYKPISVISHLNIAYSSKPFILTFAGGGIITPASFGQKYTFFAGNGTGFMEVADLNNDNLPDLVNPVLGTSGAPLLVQTNMSKVGAFLFFEDEIRNSTKEEDSGVAAAIADFDKDGKLDIVYVGSHNFNAVVDKKINFNNNLSPDPNFFSDNYSNTYLGLPPKGVGASDMDGDGTADIVYSLPTAGPPLPNITLADIDGDGKADLLVWNGSIISLYRNISTKGNIAYAPNVDFNAGSAISSINVGDFDGDGKLDIAAILPGGTGSVAVFLNAGSTGNFSFTKTQPINNITSATLSCTGDLDGDGKIDLVVATGTSIAVYKNTGTPGAVSFAPAVIFAADGHTGLLICDLDGDGKPDIAGVSQNTGEGFILRNLNGPSQISFSPAGGASGQIVNISGSGFTGTTAITIGGYNVKSFTVNSDNSITAVAGADTTGFIKIVTPGNTINSITPFVFLSIPIITAATPLNFASGGSVQLTAAPASSSYTFQWAKNGVIISGATQSNYTANATGSYTVSFSYNGTTLTSNALTVNVQFTLPVNNFKLTITSATCKGSNNGSVNIAAIQSLSYTATITGNGLNISYPFTTSQNIPNLTAGTYSICFTVAGQSSYQECFTVVVTEPKDLSVYSVVNPFGNTINLSLNGGAQYTINLNNVIYTTTSSTITLQLKPGNNDLAVTTDKLCQGTFEKLINVSGNIAPYPDPFQNTLNINLGNENITNVSIQIHNVPDGTIIYSKQYLNQSGVLQLDLSNLRSGVYSLHLRMDGSVKIFKIQKK